MDTQDDIYEIYSLARTVVGTGLWFESTGVSKFSISLGMICYGHLGFVSIFGKELYPRIETGAIIRADRRTEEPCTWEAFTKELKE